MLKIQKVTLYIPDDLHDQLKLRSAVDGEPMSSIAQRAIDFYLGHPDAIDQSAIDQTVDDATPNPEAPLVSSGIKLVKQKVTLYIPDDLHRQFKIRSAVDGEPMSSIAQRAIDFYLGHPDAIDQSAIDQTVDDATPNSEAPPVSSDLYNAQECKKKAALNIDFAENISDDLVALEVANLCKALNAYHIACGGTGLAIDDWEILIRARQLVRL